MSLRKAQRSDMIGCPPAQAGLYIRRNQP
ncbi:protein of unknown function [Methylorubrum extorquens]|uniref:Uncharacterized protein n=1 Tax=Methylorubrum extorquens TaxID=408 RepID=A0A2N9AN92_METEX|nr:protein of unknown function [Methylorubrum extorquens]